MCKSCRKEFVDKKISQNIYPQVKYKDCEKVIVNRLKMNNYDENFENIDNCSLL